VKSSTHVRQDDRPVWSEKKIAQLRAAMERAPFAGFERAAAECRIRAAEEDISGARDILIHAADALPSGEEARESAHLLTVTAVSTGQMDLAAYMIGRFLEPELPLSISVEETPKRETPTVRWNVSDDGASSFELNPFLLRADNSEMYINRWVRSLKLAHAYVRSGGRQAGAVHLSLEDHGTLLGLSFCDNRRNAFLIPDPYFIRTKGYAAVREHFWINDVPWEQRVPVAFWRGSSSGAPESRAIGWRTLPRIKLCELARQNPELIDAVITQIGQMPDARSLAELKGSGLMGPPVPITELNRYRYQIDIDGNTNSWPGLFQKLLSGSPVLKVASPAGYQQWYYDKLRPWITHIPVLSDLSDLVQKIHWLQEHDSEAREIGRRGRMLALSLEYEKEVTRGADTIAAAFRYFAGLPEQELLFGLGRRGNASLVRGWSAAEEDAVPALGWQSELELTKPAGCCGDLDLDLDVVAVTSAPSPTLTVVVNGEMLQRITVAESQVVRCRIPARLITGEKPISVTLLHANTTPLASDTRPFDERIGSIRLRRLTLHRVDAKGAQVLAPRIHRPAVQKPSQQSAIMQALHGEDIWHGFLPRGPNQQPIHGWNGVFPPFKGLLSEVNNKIFVDVGVWKGQSTVFVAESMRDADIDGCVISIDTFLGSLEHSLRGRPLFKRTNGRPDLYETFLDNVFYRNLTHLVVPLPQTSLCAARVLRHFNITAGIVHIDASHTYEDVLADVEAYWPLIAPGGYLVGDNYHQSWPGVVKAAQEFSRRVGIDLSVMMPKWLIQKPS